MKINELGPQIKKYIETKLGLYRYNNDEELEQIIEIALKFIEQLSATSPKNRMLLEHEINTIKLSQSINGNYETIMTIKLLEETDFFKFYDLLDQKLGLRIGLHHSYARNISRWAYYITINGLIIDLISDNYLDHEWMKYYFNNNSNLEKTNEKSNLKLQKILFQSKK